MQMIRSAPEQAPFERWVEEQYGVEASTFGAADDPDYTNVRWETEGRAYNAIFDDGELRFVRGDLFNDALTLAQSIDCLGAPDSYRARLLQPAQGYTLEVEIWYPEAGYALTFVETVGNRTRVSLHRELPVSWILYLPTTTIEEGYTAVHQDATPEERLQWFDSLKPWREDLESVEVEWE